MIEVKDLVKRYGETTAVNEITFSVKKGEIVGFLGPNGAGKTTAMRVITCYLPYDSGQVTVDGMDILEDSITVRSHIGYLPESAPLYRDMGVVEYLQFIGKMRGLSGSELNQRIDLMLDVCGLKGVAHKDINELSKGYRQRVGLAQAMIHDPEILILDEPTSGLDPNQIIEIRKLIKEVGKEKTVILSTHILPEVQITCDRVIIINKGKIVATGTADDLASMVKGREVYWVSIRADKKEVSKALATIGQIEKIEIDQKLGKDYYRYRLECGQEANIGEDIFQTAVSKGWSLSELYPQRYTLEDAFVQLTTEEK